MGLGPAQKGTLQVNAGLIDSRAGASPGPAPPAEATNWDLPNSRHLGCVTSLDSLTTAAWSTAINAPAGPLYLPCYEGAQTDLLAFCHLGSGLAVPTTARVNCEDAGQKR